MRIRRRHASIPPLTAQLTCEAERHWWKICTVDRFRADRQRQWIELLELGMEIPMSLFSKNITVENRLTELTRSFPVRCVPLAFVGILLVVARHGIWQGVGAALLAWLAIETALFIRVKTAKR